MDNIFVGERLTNLRKLKGRTQADVAAQFGVSKQAVSKWEKGLSMPDVLILPDLAAYFGVEIGYFFDKAHEDSTRVPLKKEKVAIQVRDLTKRYKGADAPVLKGINIDIYDGLSTAIMGPSGCGKTTFVNCISGLETITGGSVIMFDQDIANLKEPKLTEFRRTHTNYIFQQYNLVDVLNVLDNIKLPYKTSGQKIDRARLKELIERLGLSGKEKMMPTKLSGGQQQRVAIARALLGKGKLILADEPTGALDVNTGNDVLELLLAGSKEFGSPAVIITHDSKVAAKCDIVHFLLDGNIVKTLERPDASEVSKVMVRLSENV
ncbi:MULTISPECIES: ATP-binding cassette domain-containing protein [Halobacillus]|uniref:ATP-binding cassette domain-containing protein n=1 Tax=Halobacillus TaxID=45667 RepID=UPI0004146909|nr:MULTISPECIES: ATP-binding cassette domain-containing protein [Halobacillus]